MKLDAARLTQPATTANRDIRLYLLFGPDEAGAAAAAKLLARAFDDEAERVDLDGATLRRDPARLADEAASLSLFGGVRYIRVAGVGDESAEAIGILLAAERAGNPVIALAPGMRATARLAKLVLASPLAYACAFYDPGPAELERIAAGQAREVGVQADPGVLRDLIEASGGDRAVVASELTKIALFLDAAPERPARLDQATLDTIGADRGESAQAAIVAAIVDGEVAALGQALERVGLDGASPVPWLRALTRRLLALAEMRAAVDDGEAPAAVVKRHRIFFREEAATLTALRRWTPTMLATAVARTRAAERAVMASGNAGAVLADAAAIGVARGVAARR